MFWVLLAACCALLLGGANIGESYPALGVVSMSLSGLALCLAGVINQKAQRELPDP